MASAAVSTFVACYNPPVVATQCGIVYCSKTLDDFLINCTTCSQEFNLLSCSLFIKHVKECLCVDIPNRILGQQTDSNDSFANTYLPTIKYDKTDDCTAELNFDPLLPMKMETGDIEETAHLPVDESEEDVNNLSDYKDEDDLTINKVAQRTMVEEIINQYRKHPKLWDANLSETVTPAEQKVHFNHIRDVINSNFKTNFTESEIRKQIHKLICGYKRVIRLKDKLHRKPTLWYFHKIAFIDGSFFDIGVEDKHEQAVLLKEEISEGQEPSDSECTTLKSKKNRNKVPHLNERKIILDIINLYKKYSILWNPRSPGYKNRSKRSAALCRIASIIQKKYKRKVTAHDVNSKIETLRASCRRQRLRNKAGSDISLWYYDKLSFVWKSKQAGNRSEIPQELPIGDPADDNETSDPDQQSDISDDDEDSFVDNEDLNDRDIVLELIKEYEKQPCLWNNEIYNSSSRSYRYLMLQSVKNTINSKFNKEFTEEDIRNKIRLLRSGYRNVLHRMAAFEKDPSNADKKFDTNVNYFENLSFLGTTESDMLIKRQKKPRSSKPRWPRKYKKDNENQMSQDSDEEEVVNPDDLFNFDKSKPYEGTLTKNKELLTFIIEEYKKHTCLWSKGNPFDDNSSRNRAYANMVAVINDKFGTTFNNRTLINEIRSLRYSYSRMLRGKKENAQYKTKMWYADMLSFIEAQSQDVEGTEDDTLSATLSGVGRTKYKTEDHVFAIIDLYKAAPILWDTNHSGFMSRNERRKHYNNIIATLSEKYDYNITFEELKHQIRYLRVTYFRSLRNEIAYQEGDLSKYASKAYFFDRLSFLKPFANTKPTTSPLLQVDCELDPNEDYTFLTENNALMLSFIQLYQDSGCLWDQNHKDINNPSAVSDAYGKIINMFQKNGVTLTKDQVISAISFLHATVVSTQNASEAYDMNETNEKPVWFYQHLEFLGKIPRPNNKYCTHCNQIFRTVAAFKKHKIQIGDYPFKCLVCGKGFLSRSKYDYHKILHREPYKCDQCDFQAHCKQNFKVHMLRHQGITPYECEHCQKRFVTTNELKRHLRTHTGEKPYICDICGKNVSSSTEFSRHMKRHRNQRDHKCEICGKDFFTNTSLRDHMTTHSDERNHICGTCGAAFKRRKTLCQHEALHAEKKKHNCKICGQLFAQKAGVYSHMKSHGLMIGNSEVGQK